MAKTQRECELCDGVAAVYCPADEANICWTCDAKVHGANFLVARHTRSVLCGTCGLPTPWRASGANPTPITGTCANCTQGEAQGECATFNDVSVDIRRVASRLCPTVEGCSDPSCESGCSSSNPEICEGREIEGDTIRASPCESSSQLTSEDMEGATVDCMSAQASVTSGISQSLKRKRSLDCCPSASVPQSKQIETRALEDVNGRAAHRQSACDSTTSSSSNSGSRASHAHEGCSFEAPDCTRFQPHVLGSSKRTPTTPYLSSAKRQRMDASIQMRPFLSRSQQSTVLSASRLTRMLAKWHWDLQLSSPGTVPLALRMFRTVCRALALAVLSNSGMRVTLAACLRLAAGLDEAQITVPKASVVAACAGVSTRRLAMTEIHFLALLGCRRFPLWAGVRS